MNSSSVSFSVHFHVIHQMYVPQHPCPLLSFLLIAYDSIVLDTLSSRGCLCVCVCFFSFTTLAMPILYLYSLNVLARFVLIVAFLPQLKHLIQFIHPEHIANEIKSIGFPFRIHFINDNLFSKSQ